VKVSLKWLRSYTPATAPVDEIARRLTMGGVEVADIYRVGENWTNVYVGEVLELRPHPNADRLVLATVGYGAGRAITVVTGAPNLYVGAKVPLALAGAMLIDTHVDPPQLRELQPVKLRGILSEGMVCSAKELGLGMDHQGILILEPDATPGIPLGDDLGDVILDLDVTPNRVDCFSMLGVAREVAALLGEEMSVPVAAYPEGDPPASALVGVEIVDPELCPRYSAAVIQGVTIGTSPRWLRDRLTAAGLRPINNVVDVTNYVMLEWGQPLHAFDYDKVRGRKIIVRRAGEGEKIALLDGTERTLDHENLVIADGDGAIAVAGVMGGGESEVTEATRNVLLESANFHPISVRRTARSLKLLTDAAHRFERGLPRQLTEPAARRATQLVLSVAGGQAARGIVDAYPQPTTLPEIYLTPGEVKRVLGIERTVDQIAGLLRRIDCFVTAEENELRVVPPLARTDLTIPADLCEEVARLLGYDEIPSTLPYGRQPEPKPNEDWRWRDSLRETLTGLGLSEIVTYALTSRERLGRLGGESTGWLGGAESSVEPKALGSAAAAIDLGRAVTERFVPLDLEPIEVLNPLSRESEVLRTSTLGAMLETLSANSRLADRDVALFEIGRSYLPRVGALPEEPRFLTVGAGAYRSGASWGERVPNDFFWLKGIAEAAFARLNLDRRGYRPLRHPLFHPTRSAVIVTTGGEERLLGVLGEVEPDVRAAFDVEQPAYLLAIDLDLALSLATRARVIAPIPRFPPVVQDLALIVATGVSSEAIVDLIREVGMPLVKSVELFDIYQGPPIPAGKINLAYHITYQAPERTLTDAEVAEVQRKVEQAVTGRLGAELRR
jgi:phenylalanyl-tRNA synthetase beta chain